MALFREKEGRLGEGRLEDSSEEKYRNFHLKGVSFPEAKWDPWVPAVGCAGWSFRMEI